MWRRLAISASVLAVGMMAAACGGGGGGDALTEAIAAAREGDLASMALTQDDLADLLADLADVQEDSGFSDSERRAEDTIDPEDTAEDLEAAGWLAGYYATFQDPDLSAFQDGQGLVSVITQLDLFEDTDAAADFFAKQGDDFRRLEGEEAGDGFVLAKVQTFGVDVPADETMGIQVLANVEELEFQQTIVAFRLERLVAAVVVFRADDSDITPEASEMALALRQRIEEMLTGEGPASAAEAGGDQAEPSGHTDPQLAGDWRVYSERIDFDAGGGGGTDASSSVTRKLSLNEDGTWEFGTSNGTWSVTSIEPDDWERWRTEPYGPEHKIVLDGWNDAFSDGPIEEAEEGVDLFWLFYHVDEPEPGTVQLKFGHP